MNEVNTSGRLVDDWPDGDLDEAVQLSEQLDKSPYDVVIGILNSNQGRS